MAWTFTVVVLPFPTALVLEAAAQPGTKAFYVGTMAVSSALLALPNGPSARPVEAGR